MTFPPKFLFVRLFRLRHGASIREGVDVIQDDLFGLESMMNFYSESIKIFFAAKSDENLVIIEKSVTFARCFQ